ncbi:hypothetical protein Tco_0310152, partial [Tanacetum coccineum]
FFLTNNTGAPHGDELGRINPFSDNSCNWSASSFSSDGANRYGARATGASPGTSSILNSTCRGGGSPGKSSRNTSGKSRIIGTSSKRFSFGSFSVTCATHNDPRDPYVAARDAATAPATDTDDAPTQKETLPSEPQGSPPRDS